MFARLNQIRALARFTPFDTTTEEGRSNERHRLILFSAVATILARCVSVATVFISIPLSLNYLGVERFGLWMTMSSVIAMLNFADLGIGNGLLNSIADAHGKDDQHAISSYISSAFAILSGLTVLILFIFFMIYPFVPWAEFFNVKSPIAIQEAGKAIAVFVICFSLSITVGVVQRTQMGLQMSFVASLWQIVSSLLGLGAVLLAIKFEMGLPWLIAGMAGAPVVVAVINGLYFFGRTRADIRPKKSLISYAAMQKIAHIGFLFFILQVTGAIAFSSDNIVISRMLDAGAVTQYAIPEKIFSVIPMILGMMLMPLWPAYGEALSRGDKGWVKKIFMNSLVTSIGFATITSLIFVFWGDQLLRIWVGHDVNAPLLLLVGMGLWRIAESVGNSLAMFLNASNVIKLQVVINIVFLTCVVPLKVFLVHYIGIAGAVWSTFIAYLLCVLLPYLYLIPQLLKRITYTEAP